MKLDRRMFGLLVAGGLALAGSVADARDLRTNINADPEMIDPITYSALIAGDVLRNVYQGFTDVGRSGAVEPALAVKWTAHPDNLGWRFELRKGVKFHSGRDFTARDIKTSFERLLAPGSRAGLALQYLQRIEGAKAVADGQSKDLVGVKPVDDHTVDIRFTAPDVLFPIYPFMIFDAQVIDEKGPEWFLQASAGTGPFSFVHWKRGQEVRLAAHKSYWGGAPRIDGVTYLIVPSEDTAASMFEAGELDLLNVAGTDLSRRLMRDAKLRERAITAPAAQINYLGMNQNLYAPFKDKRVREAFCLAIDRDGLSRGLFGGLAQPLAGQVTPGFPGATPDQKPLVFNAERAKALLAEAGFPEGRNMPPLKIAALAPFRNENAYYADQWKKVLGLNIEIEIMERATFLRALNAGEVPLFAWGWSAGYPDALYFLSQVWHSKSPYNRARYANAEFDRLIDQAHITPDSAPRYALYNQAEKVLLDEFGTCGLFVRTQVALVKANVKGVTLTPMRYLPYGDVTIE